MKKPYIELCCSEDFKLEEQRKFNMEFIVIAELFTSYTPEFKIQNVKKIRINLSPKTDNLYISNPSRMFPMYLCEEHMNYSEYESIKDEKGKKIYLSEIVIKSIRKTANKLGWEIAPFNIAYEKIKNLDYEYKVESQKRKWSENKKIKASVELELRFGVGIISVLFFDKKELLLKKIVAFKAQPHPIILSMIINKIDWVSDDEFMISNTNGEINIKVSFSKEKVEYLFIPKIYDKQYLEEELLLLKYDTSVEQLTKIDKDRQTRYQEAGKTPFINQEIPLSDFNMK